MKKIIRSARALLVLWQDNTSIAGQIGDVVSVALVIALVYSVIQLIRCI